MWYLCGTGLSTHVKESRLCVLCMSHCSTFNTFRYMHLKLTVHIHSVVTLQLKVLLYLTALYWEMLLFCWPPYLQTPAVISAIKGITEYTHHTLHFGQIHRCVVLNFIGLYLCIKQRVRHSNCNCCSLVWLVSSGTWSGCQTPVGVWVCVCVRARVWVC